jgi:hypothetical protein
MSSSFVAKLTSLPFSHSLSIRSSSSQGRFFLCMQHFFTSLFSYQSHPLKADAAISKQDWRKRSKPIPPGGTYPAKDQCRYISLFHSFSLSTNTLFA